MDSERFVKCVRELSHFMVDFSVNLENVECGKWRAVKQDLPNGDVKALIYRKVSEITVIYNTVGKDQEVDMDVMFRKSAEPLFYEAILDFTKEKRIPLEDNDPSILTAIVSFTTLDDFEKFIYSYLLPLGY